MNKVLHELGLTSSNNNLLSNLTKVPRKEPKSMMAHTTASQPFTTEKADLLFLPNDNGYKYLLVVVDIATRKTDAEPIKNKDNTTLCANRTPSSG